MVVQVFMWGAAQVTKQAPANAAVQQLHFLDQFGLF